MLHLLTKGNFRIGGDSPGTTGIFRLDTRFAHREFEVIGHSACLLMGSHSAEFIRRDICCMTSLYYAQP